MEFASKKALSSPVFFPPLTTCCLLLALHHCGFDRGDSHTDPPISATVDFANDVVPILRQRCVACHAPGLPAGATLFVLSSDAGGDYSVVMPLVSPENPDDSYLLKKASNRITHGGGPILSVPSMEYQLILRWISEGAKIE